MKKKLLRTIFLACLVVFPRALFSQDNPVQELAELGAKAEQGDAKAQNRLGEGYKLGRGVNKDENEARKWFRKAAEQGSEVVRHKGDNKNENPTITIHAHSFRPHKFASTDSSSG